MVHIGIDNGISGSIGILTEDGGAKFYHTPVMKLLHYTKQKQFFSRIDTEKLERLFRSFLCPELTQVSLLSSFVFLERPMVNPMRFKATESALRAYEATLIVLERLRIGYRVIDSKEWQKQLLPTGIKGSSELKKASLDIGKRTFPQIDFTGFTDSDGLLIAEYNRRCYK